MGPRLFRFSSFPDPLWVWGSRCANPDCERGEAFLDLVEEDSEFRMKRHQATMTSAKSFAMPSGPASFFSRLLEPFFLPVRPSRG